MKRQRGHKARLYLTPSQLTAAEDQGHAARAMWNCLHSWWTMLPKDKRTLGAADEAIRQGRKDLDFLGALPARAAQQVLKTYFRAWVNCWEGRAQAPTFKARFRSRMAIDIPQGRGLQIVRLNRRWGRMWAPTIGHVLFRWTKDLPAGKRADKLNKVTGARLVREADGWHVVFRVQTEVPDPSPHSGPTVGIGRGIAKPLALSDGTFREHSDWLTPGETKRLRRREKEPEWKTWPSPPWSSPPRGPWKPPAGTSARRPDSTAPSPGKRGAVRSPCLSTRWPTEAASW
ncbi:hypothetical protein [Streptomyces blattellae]|uniref:hypothetical protein n=1 Tax=Streptomyces blattellae TaxID=2569855 RepID=UPI0038B4CB75